MNSTKPEVVNAITYDNFRELAKNSSLSKYERVGFPDAYRKCKEENIFSDICAKLVNLNNKSRTVLEIGPGCSDLPLMLMALCERNWHRLFLVDSPEMLALIPDKSFVEKVEAYYPDGCQHLVEQLNQKVDVLIAYSVFQSVFNEGNIFSFLDVSLSLLAEGGEMLIGDIPNVSKRKRFFSSENGKRFHKQFMKTTDDPDVKFNNIECNQIDDAIIIALLFRARLAGFDAYLLPQSFDLPMANRREDILIRRP